MSVTQTLRAVELFRSMGVPVTFEPGWDTRGNGQSSSYQGGILHHTGGSYAATCPGILIYGRSDLSGPLCNFAGLTNGGIHVVAAHPANHAGASGGPDAAPFPITTLFNKLVMGLEICYPGSQPMTNEQYHTAKVFAKVMQIMYGSIERARAHRETSVEGKWDPGWAPGQTINMAELRAAAANVEGDTMSAADAYNGIAAVIKDMRDGKADDLANGLREVLFQYGMPKAPDVEIKADGSNRTTIHDEVRWLAPNFAAVMEAAGKGGSKVSMTPEDRSAIVSELKTELAPLFELARRLES